MYLSEKECLSDNFYFDQIGQKKKKKSDEENLKDGMTKIYWRGRLSGISSCYQFKQLPSRWKAAQNQSFISSNTKWYCFPYAVPSLPYTTQTLFLRTCSRTVMFKTPLMNHTARVKILALPLISCMTSRQIPEHLCPSLSSPVKGEKRALISEALVRI